MLIKEKIDVNDDNVKKQLNIKYSVNGDKLFIQFIADKIVGKNFNSKQELVNFVKDLYKQLTGKEFDFGKDAFAESLVTGRGMTDGVISDIIFEKDGFIDRLAERFNLYDCKDGDAVLGAIIGDIVGSRFEFNNYRKKDFELFDGLCFFTDDTVMTLSIAKAINENKNIENLASEVVKNMQEIGRNYPTCGYGGRFYDWIYSDNPAPYNSFGNGSAMRVSYCGMVGKSLDEVKRLSYEVTKVSHNHYEGIKGAEATAVCIYLAKIGKTKEEIGKYVRENYYKIDFTLDQIRPTYKFNEICQDTVPQAICAFLESTSFEDAIKNAISIGGDSDTIGAITGAIAGVYYQIPEDIKVKAIGYLDSRMKSIYQSLKSKT